MAQTKGLIKMVDREQGAGCSFYIWKYWGFWDNSIDGTTSYTYLSIFGSMIQAR